MPNTDIAVLGGGVIGSAIAYFLARSGRAGHITVVEPDNEYVMASSPNGAGGVRQMFSQPENIAMSQFSLEFYRNFAQQMGDDADIDFVERGYLFVVGEQGARQLEENCRRQVALGAETAIVDRSELRERYPSLGVSDIALGCLSPNDGTLTSSKVLCIFRREAERLGVDYIADRIVDLEIAGNRVQSARLETGGRLHAESYVNAAGAWANDIAEMAGLSLPVVPMCRVKHYWTCADELEDFPLVKDESGLFFRPDGDGFIGGRPSWEIKPGFVFDKHAPSLNSYFEGYFDRVVRPLLQVRLPAFESAIEHKTWTGHYAQNTFDGNMILGQMGTTAINLYTACGFSGHGTMHAPAVGKALSELILDGGFAAMDLSRMSYQRLLDNAPYPERGVV